MTSAWSRGAPVPSRHRRLALAVAAAGLVAFLVARGPGPSARTDTLVTPPEVAGPAGSRPGAPPPAQKPEPVDDNADRLRGPHLPASPPIAVRIPELGLSAPLIRLGLTGDGTMEVPQAGGEVGWFDGSVTPGAVGPSVLAAHVTWDGVPAAFFELATLRPLDRVVVRRQDGSVAVFDVTRVTQFPKARFPTAAVYGATDHAALRLITCGGRFDTEDRHYTDNVVIFGRLVGVRR